MLEKRLDFPGIDPETGRIFVEAYDPNASGLTKTAKVQKDYAPEVHSYLKGIGKRPGKIYVLVNALGAAEFYGQNINGDIFPEDSLVHVQSPTYGYKTFYGAGVYRHHCFPAGTGVLTKDRTRVAIDEIRIGDEVQTLQGPLPVTAVMRRPFEGPGISLTLKGRLDPLVATEKHSVLVYRRDQVHCRHKYSKLAQKCSCKECKEPIGAPEWVPIKDVLPGDYLVFPHPVLQETHEVTPCFARLVGWVASEGCLGARGLIQFTFSENNEEDISSVTECLQENGLRVTTTPRPQQGVVLLSSCSKELHAKLAGYVAGVKSEKALTGQVLCWTRENLLQMLGAYIDGDGHVPSSGKNSGQLRIRSSSRQMLHILGDVIRGLGIPCALNWDSQPGTMESPVAGYGPYWSDGSGCVAVQAALSPEICKYSRKKFSRESCRSPQVEVYEGSYLARVTDREELLLAEDVYNLEVAGPHHYIANEVVVHNCNKDPARSFGKIVLATYNHKMHRVELCICIDKAKARAEGHSSLVDQLEKGENVSVSMGCRVPYDECSLCGHKSKTLYDRCSCISTRLNEVLPDGRKVGMINYWTKFFDLSFVLIGADKTGYLMEKVASVRKLAEEKLADITKDVPGLANHLGPMFSREGTLPEELLQRLSNRPLGSALGSLLGKGIILKPNEFQRIVIVKRVGQPMASSLFRGNAVFQPSSSGHGMRPVDFSHMGTPLPGRAPMAERSMFCPHSYSRLSKLATPTTTSEERPLSDEHGKFISALYFDYRSQLLDNLDDSLLDGGLEKAASAATLAKVPAWALLLPLVYMYSAHLRKKERRGMSIGGVRKFIANHPVIASSVMMGLAANTKNIKNALEALPYF